MKKAAIMIFPMFCMQEISCLTALFKWYDKPITIFASTLNPVSAEDGFTILPDQTFETFNSEDYDCLVIPGIWDFRPALNDDRCIRFLKSLGAHEQLLIASISASPILLAKAGLLENHTFTSGLFEEIIDEFPFIPRENIVRKPLVKSGNLITAVGFAFREFALSVTEALGFENHPETFMPVPPNMPEDQLVFQMPPFFVEQQANALKIGLVSAKMTERDVTTQIDQIEDFASLGGHDLICFGESYLQGFEGLTWDYDQDLQIALTVEDEGIERIRSIAKRHQCAISFGFIEKEGNQLYSANMVIGKNGETVDLYRRVSKGWKEPIANEKYAEGDGFHTFEYLGKTFATAICGDLFYESHIKDLSQLKVDALLWPLYVDYSISDWREKAFDDYKAQTRPMPYPVLMINSFVDVPTRANGGCYVFQHGGILSALPMGEVGIHTFKL